MRILLLLPLFAILISCASSNPRVENCKIACEGKGRHSSDMINHCKQMCEKYK